MVDGDLIDAIREKIMSVPGLSQLSEAQAAEVLGALARQSVTDPAQIWWWANLTVDHETISYGERDGLEEVARIVPHQATALLVVTDDEPRPWPVFLGKTSDLLAALREVRFCEYFLVDQDFKWIVFDTHHNTLVVVGNLIGMAKQTPCPKREHMGGRSSIL